MPRVCGMMTWFFARGRSWSDDGIRGDLEKVKEVRLDVPSMFLAEAKDRPLERGRG